MYGAIRENRVNKKNGKTMNPPTYLRLLRRDGFAKKIMASLMILMMGNTLQAMDRGYTCPPILHTHQSSKSIESALNQEQLNNKFLEAVKWGWEEKAERYLKKGAAINAKAPITNYSALMLAVYLDRLEMCKLLIAKGADLNAIDESGNTALMVAAEKGNKEICILLIHAMTTISDADAHAIRKNYYILASSMKKQPALRTHPDTRRLVLQSFIEALVQERMENIVQPMINHKNNKGRSAREIALKKGHDAVANLLDLNNPESREKIRLIVEASIKQAIRLHPTPQIKTNVKEPK
jgi:ankyrin repeat protein